MRECALRELHESQIPDLIALSKRLGWDYEKPELQTVFRTGHLYGHVTAFGRVISCAAVFPYGNQLASLGMVMVDPDYRGLGLGRAVTKQCLASTPKMPVTLIATAEGKPLYEKLGFKTVDRLHKLIGPYHAPDQHDLPLPVDVEMTPVQDDHLNDVLRLDSMAVGQIDPFLSPID